MNIFILLLPLVIGLTWLRLIRPGPNQQQGTTILIVTLPLLARIRMHAVPALIALGLGLWFAVTGDIPWWAVAFPIVSDILLIALPVRYTLTDVGIQLGWTAFRRWTEFAGVRRAAGGARLVGVHKTRGMHIWLAGARGDDEFLHFLRQTLKNAYKGQATVSVFPGGRSSPGHSSDNGEYHGSISAYFIDQ